MTQTKDAASALAAARAHLLACQDGEGWWKGELETNVTMDAEDMFLREFLGIRDDAVTRRAAKWIRSNQRDDGTWATFHGGPGDLSTTVEAYVALRLAGDPADAAHMSKAARFVRGAGGVERSRVFTRMWLAMFGLWSWDEVPAIPPEIIWLPAWVPLNVYDFACWARQTIVALTVVATHRPVHELQFLIEELLTHQPLPPPPPLRTLAGVFWQAERWILKPYGRHRPAWVRKAALRAVEAWILARQEADGCWGGIQPPWVYSLIALRLQGYPLDHPAMRAGIAGLESFVIDDEAGRRFEACQSPVWDTALAVVALADAGVAPDDPAMQAAGRWLVAEEVRRPGDWSVRRPELAPGGWAFEFHNDVYPDVDDSSEVILALRRVRGVPGAEAAIASGVRWVEGMQSEGGGWAAFDADNTREMLTAIPFCDFGEVIDPPSSDVTAHAIEMLVAEPDHHPARLARALAWLAAEQEPDGAWFGRWGCNYIYGTGAAVPALVAAGVPRNDPSIRRAVRWLEEHQHPSGGWGEDLRSYQDPAGWRGRGEPTASQTAWALIALLAAGERDSEATARGVCWLVETQRSDGTWDEPWFTGTGFPWDFSINYHMYRLIFPLMALARWVRGDPSDHGHRPPVASPLTVLTPLGLEAAAVRRGAPGARVVVTGTGPERSLRSRGKIDPVPGDPVPRSIPGLVVMGVCGALRPGLSAGDLVVATEVRSPDGGVVALPAADSVATSLRAAGHVVHRGPIASTDHIVRGAERAALGATGAVAVDMESAWLVGGAGGSGLVGAAGGLEGAGAQPGAVVRVVLDTPACELFSPGALPAGLRAWRQLSRAASCLAAARFTPIEEA